MRAFVASVCFILGLPGATVMAAEPAQSCSGIWASSGLSPHVGDAYTADEIPSPNKQYVLSFTEDAVRFNHVGEKPIDIVIPINLSLMEVVWASTSDAFAINVSDGDASGPWQMFVYRVDANGVLQAIASDAVKEVAMAVASCESDKSPSVVTVGWLPEGKELGVAVIARESCRKNVKTWMLRVSSAGKIVEKLSLDEFKGRWPQSGCRLQ